jgi:hypothetical protein
MEYGDKRFLTANDTAIAFIPASRGSPLAEVSIYDLRMSNLMGGISSTANLKSSMHNLMRAIIKPSGEPYEEGYPLGAKVGI